MLSFAVAARVLFAAPETTSAGAAPAQAAAAAPPATKPEMRKVCTTVELSGSNLPKKKCRMEPVKTDPKIAEGAPAPDAAKPE